jgi:hypothetical protein
MMKVKRTCAAHMPLDMALRPKMKPLEQVHRLSSRDVSPTSRIGSTSWERRIPLGRRRRPPTVCGTLRFTRGVWTHFFHTLPLLRCSLARSTVALQLLSLEVWRMAWSS